MGHHHKKEKKLKQTILATLGDSLKNLEAKYQTFISTVIKNPSATNLEDLFTTLKTSVVGEYDKFVKPEIGAVKSKLAQFNSAVDAVANPELNALKTKVNDLVGNVATVSDQLRSAIQNSNYKNVVAGAYKNVRTNFDTIKNKVVGEFANVKTNLPVVLGKLRNAGVNPNILHAVGQTFESKVADVLASVGGTHANFASLLANL